MYYQENYIRGYIKKMEDRIDNLEKRLQNKYNGDVSYNSIRNVFTNGINDYWIQDNKKRERV